MSKPNVFGPPIHKALYKELDELHSYDRLHIQLFMGWFAFFSTINIAALGWIATADPKPLVRACIALNFLTQSVLAILACRAVREAFEKSGQRIEVILQQIDSTGRARSPLPLELYKKSNRMVAGGCAILSVLWMVILASMLVPPPSQPTPTRDTATDSAKNPTSFRTAPSAIELEEQEFTMRIPRDHQGGSGTSCCQKRMRPVEEPGGASHSPVFDVRVPGGREHNLKNVDIDIPRDPLSVFTGASGSAKSSFGTL